jgi:hypothetical protein
MTSRSFDAIRDAVHQLHTALDGYTPGVTDALEAAVREYAVVVANVNARLRTAHALLRQHRRADAVHACEIEPNALEVVGELDVSDQAIEAWLPTFDELGIARPERIRSDLAGELSEAYAVVHQLEPLMRRHRLLAISRGPLEERIRVLRSIIDLDAESPSWLDDLAAYEARWKADLQRELGQIKQLSPQQVTPIVAQRVRSLVDQLASAEWHEPFDEDSVRWAQSIESAVRKTLIRAELADLAAGLAKAHADADLSRAIDLHERWMKLSSQTSLPANHPAADKAGRCLEWVRQQLASQASETEWHEAADNLRALLLRPLPITPRAARAAAEGISEGIHRLESVPVGDATSTDHTILVAEAASQLRRLAGIRVRFWVSLGAASLAAFATAGLAVRTYLHRRPLGPE